MEPTDNECRTALLPFVNELRKENGMDNTKWIHVVERKWCGEIGLSKMESPVIISGQILEKDDDDDDDGDDQEDRTVVLNEAKRNAYECRFLTEEVNCAPCFLLWKKKEETKKNHEPQPQQQQLVDFRQFHMTHYDKPLEISVGKDTDVKKIHETLLNKYPLLQYRINNNPEFQNIRSKADQDITVVSAYYQISSKYSDDTYKRWIVDFFRLPCHKLIFTDAESVDDLKKMAKVNNHTHFIVQNKMEWEVLEDVPLDVWEAQVKMDPETKQVNHTAWLYALWNQKPYFVKRATELNPFATSWFCWTDIGCIRRPHLVDECFLFPSVDRLSEKQQNNKPIFMELQTISTTDKMLDSKTGLPKLVGNELSLSGPRACQNTVRIQGGFFAGTIAACQSWLNHYRTVLRQFKDTGTFCGKDQNVIFATSVLHPDCVTLVPARDWFQFLLEFS